MQSTLESALWVIFPSSCSLLFRLFVITFVRLITTDCNERSNKKVFHKKLFTWKKRRKKVKKEFSMDEWSRTKTFLLLFLPSSLNAQKDELWIIVYLHTHTQHCFKTLIQLLLWWYLMPLHTDENFDISQRDFFLFCCVCARVQSQEINAQFFEWTFEHENFIKK